MFLVYLCRAKTATCMRSILKLFTLLCLFFGACWLTGEWLDASVAADTCSRQVCATGAGRADGKSLCSTSDVHCPQAEPVNHSGGRLSLPIRVQRCAEQGYHFSLRFCGELISHYLASLTHRQVTFSDRMAVHPLQPVCAYYIYALRRILI